jgi:hypothetical protein
MRSGPGLIPQSGRLDLNQRPFGPQPKRRHADASLCAALVIWEPPGIGPGQSLSFIRVANASGPRRYADAQPRLKALVARWAGLPAAGGKAAQGQRHPAPDHGHAPLPTAEPPGRARPRQPVGERERQASTPRGTIVIELTQGNLNNQHVYLRRHLDFFPADSIGGPSRQDGEGRPLTVHFEGLPEPVETDIAGGNKLFFRARRPWGDFFRLHQLHAGDPVVIERLAAYEYRVAGARNPGR